MVVADMPYGSYHVNPDTSVQNALRLMKYGGAEAVKLEGGRNRADLVRRLVDEEIPVVAHVGLTPQSVYKMGGYRVQGRTAEQAKRLIEDAKSLQDAGAFAIVLELVPREVAEIITKELTISTIGIGAGLHCDIQVLVLHDLIGMSFGRLPRFVRQYVNLREMMTDAIQRWANDVKTDAYPNETESYGLTKETLDELVPALKRGSGAD
jgi:3-methyl-2-oxobutanoate hydroxymethyltransferase